MMLQASVIAHTSTSDSSLFRSIKSGKIRLGGNKKLKIYGRLNCHSGKRMNKQNRVFFVNEKEAISADYRPCGHCMRMKYDAWKASLNNKHGVI